MPPDYPKPPVYSGQTLPRRLRRSLRRFLEGQDQALARAFPNWSAPDSGPAAAASRTSKASSSPLTLALDIQGGALNQLNPAPRGTLAALTFLDRAIASRGTNLDLVDTYFAERGDVLLALSDGIRWNEVARSQAGLPTFIPASRFGIEPNSGTDSGPLIQYALDTIPTGSTLHFKAGTYTIATGIVISRSDINIWLDPGVLWISSGVVQLLNVQGTLSAVTTTLTANVSAGAQDSIGVSSTSSFFAGDWIYVQDGTDAADGSTSQIKSELARIRSVTPGAPGSITLYEPLVNGYLTAEGASITKVTPVENVSIMGGGKITNATDTGLGFRFEYTSRCSVQGIEFEGIDRECMRWRYSVGSRVADCWMHDGARFDGSSGYGVTFTGVIGGTISGCHASRLRHAYDVSYWSRQISVVCNTARAGAQAPLMVHPSVEGCAIVGNVVDGARGFASGTPSTEMGDATDATGCTVREGGKGILIAHNVLKNCNLAGIGLIHSGCSEIAVIGNYITNCNTENGATWGGIAVGSSSAGGNQLDNLFIGGNIIENCKRYGIVCGVSLAQIRNNQITNITTTSKYGILITPFGSGTVESPVIADNSINGADYGIYLGGTALSGSGGVLSPLLVGNTIQNVQLSGIYTDFTSSVNVSSEYIAENNLINCNQSNNVNHGAITRLEANSVGVDGHPASILRNRLSGSSRFGIYSGMSNVLIAENTIENMINTDETVGLGIWVRALNAGTTVKNVRVVGNHIKECLQEGIRLGRDSSDGQVEDCQVLHNDVKSCGAAITELGLCADNLFAFNTCLDSNAATSYGLLIKGDNTKVFWNISGDTGPAAQDYGIRIESTATGVVLHDNHCFGNGTANISDGGTNTRTDRDQYETTGAAGTTTLTERVAYHGVTGTSGGTVTLPSAANVPDGHTIIIKDEGGNASVSNITVSRAGSDTIDTATTALITANFGSLKVVRRGSGKWFIT